MKINAPKVVIFKDHPEFTPNRTPDEMLKMGVFGGTYFRDIKSGVTGKWYRDTWKELPKEWVKEILETHVKSNKCDTSINYYKVKSGSSLQKWEQSGWIRKQDPYGWFQWYCRFYMGRRSDDDNRQIKRWLNYAGPRGRFRNNLINKIKKHNTRYNNFAVSPVIRQGLLQWGYELTEYDR